MSDTAELRRIRRALDANMPGEVWLLWRMKQLMCLPFWICWMTLRFAWWLLFRA